MEGGAFHLIFFVKVLDRIVHVMKLKHCRFFYLFSKGGGGHVSSVSAGGGPQAAFLLSVDQAFKI